MRPMHRLWIAAVCLAAYGTGQAQTGTPSAQTRAAERAAIADKRAAITQAQMAGEQACRQRFAVEDCLEDVRNQARAELAPLRARELTLNQQERQERAAARLQAIEAKQAQTVPPAPLQAHTRKPPPDAAALEQTQGARAAEAAARATQQRQRQAEHAQRVQAQQAQAAQRQQQAEHDWLEKQRRAKERQERVQAEQNRQRGQPLPVPPAGATPPER